MSCYTLLWEKQLGHILSCYSGLKLLTEYKNCNCNVFFRLSLLKVSYSLEFTSCHKPTMSNIIMWSHFVLIYHWQWTWQRNVWSYYFYLEVCSLMQCFSNFLGSSRLPPFPNSWIQVPRKTRCKLVERLFSAKTSPTKRTLGFLGFIGNMFDNVLIREYWQKSSFMSIERKKK